MNYNDVFSKRAKSYLYALETYPNVLQNEFITAVNMCKLNTNHVLLTIPSSCEHIKPYLGTDITHIQYETNKELSNLTNIPQCPFSSIPISDTSVDRVLSLASVHHLSNDERKLFYKEIIRILSQNGMFILGDVEEGSPQDKWLNIFVNKYNSYGHTGLFFSEKDKQLLEDAGFHVDIQYAIYDWVFETHNDMISFCRYLFHLDLASDEDIQNGLDTYLQPTENRFQWKLVYFKCSK